MPAIRKKIVSDEDWKPVAVIVDYDDWLEIERLLGLTGDEKPTDISRFIGTIHLTEDPLEYQQRIREEWP
jgi:hypothetical protein